MQGADSGGGGLHGVDGGGSINQNCYFQEKGRSQDFTFTLASTMAKKTSQLIHVINTSSRKKQQQLRDTIVSLRETAVSVMVAAKALINWLDRNPSSLVQDYSNFRTELLGSALDLTSIMVSGWVCTCVGCGE